MSSKPKRAPAKTKGTVINHRPKNAQSPWLARVWDGDHKKYINKSHATEADARQWAAETRRALIREDITAGSLPVTRALPPYLESLTRRGRDAEYCTTVESFLRRAIREIPLSNLLDADVKKKAQDWISGLGSAKNQRLPTGEVAPIAIATRSQYASRLKSWGAWCVEYDLCKKNPFHHVEAEAANAANTEPTEPFTVHECCLLTSPAATTTLEGVFVALLIYTGMRLRELAWLRREHVSFSDEIVYVHKASTADIAHSAALHAKREEKRGEKIMGRKEKKLKLNKVRRVRLEEESVPLWRRLVTSTEGYCFPESFQNRDEDDWTEMVERQCVLVGVERKGRTTRSFRCTNLCILDASGLGAGALMAHAGHSALAMLARYTIHATRYAKDCRGMNREVRLHSLRNRPTPEPEKPCDTPPEKVAQEHFVQTECNGIATRTDQSSPKEDIDSTEQGGPIVILSDDEDCTCDASLDQFSATQKIQNDVKSTCCEYLSGPHFAYEIIRKKHTECLVNGDVMTFRLAAIPLTPIR